MSDALMIKSEQDVLLKIVRKTLEEYFDGKDYIPTQDELKILSKQNRGVFVTLRKNGELRGCIGVFESDKPLAQNIKEMALAAALEDNRFSPVRKSELPDISIEISVLSPMKKISDADDIELGKHGVYIKRGSRHGVFLPQVAVETGWDKKTFLDTLCIEKAGLEPGCYKNPNTELFIFTAQIFEEKNSK